MHLHRLVEHLQGHPWRHHLDLADPRCGRACIPLIHHPGGFETEHPRHFDFHASLGDDVEIGTQHRQRLTKGLLLKRTFAHQLQRNLRLPDRPHAMMYPPRSEPALRNFKAPPLAQQHVLGRHTHVGKLDMHMSMRRVIVAKHLHGSQDLDPRCGRINNDHRMALMLRRLIVAGAHHDDVNFASRIARTRGPVFLTIQDVIIAIPHTGHRDIRGIR